MAGTTQPRILTARVPAPGGIRLELAGPGHDASIRRLLRARSMDGDVRLSLEREPCAHHAAAIEGDRHHTVVAVEEQTGELVGMGSRAVRNVWVNGRVARLGYLGQLRLRPGRRQSLRVAPAAYAALEATRLPDELPFDLTSILADNLPARRMLESPRHGLPVYRPWAEFVTVLISPGRARRPTLGVVQGTDELVPDIARCLQRNLRRYQFAPLWSEEDLRSTERTRDLNPADFLVRMDGDRVTACLARWDQRRFKQVVVRGYRPALRRLRPWANLGLAATGRRPLPAAGSTLNLAYLSHAAADGDRLELLLPLIKAARAWAAGTDIDYLVMGFAVANPLLDAVRRRFGGRSLNSVLYLVGPASMSLHGLDRRIPHVECATL